MGPTSGAHHDSRLKKALGQGFSDKKWYQDSLLNQGTGSGDPKLDQGSDGPHQPLPVEWRLGKARESSAGLSQGMSGTG